MIDLQVKMRYRTNLLNAIKVKRAELNDLESSLKVIDEELEIIKDGQQKELFDNNPIKV